MLRDCLKCEDYRKCAGTRTWFSYQEIRFCPYQVLWIIETLRADEWPPHPDSSTYTDPMIHTGYKSEAYFEKPASILGEVERRLARTGTAGKLLRAEVLAGLELSQESKDALMYVKGSETKLMSYSAWKKQRNYRV